MSFTNYFLFLFIFSVNCFIVYGFGLFTEHIIGGYSAELHDFPYQVSVLGKLDYSDEHHLLCGGGIISEWLILTAAQCFIDGSRTLRPFRFSIGAGTVDLNSMEGFFIDITKIILPKSKRRVVEDDIAIAKLNEKLDINNNTTLGILDLPSSPSVSCSNQIGVVAGYGYVWVTTDIHSFTGKVYRVDGGTDYKLKFASVAIVDDDDCSNMYDNIDTIKHLCGVMLSEEANPAWGICTRDTGSPLVIKNKVIGIVSRNTPECNDTVNGCIYTRVSAHLPFITRVQEGCQVEGISIYVNQEHIPELAT